VAGPVLWHACSTYAFHFAVCTCVAKSRCKCRSGVGHAAVCGQWTCLSSAYMRAWACSGIASIHTQQQESAFHLTVCSSCAIKRAIGSLLAFLDARASLLSEEKESIEAASYSAFMNTSVPLRPPNTAHGMNTSVPLRPPNTAHGMNTSVPLRPPNTAHGMNTSVPLRPPNTAHGHCKKHFRPFLVPTAVCTLLALLANSVFLAQTYPNRYGSTVWPSSMWSVTTSRSAATHGRATKRHTASHAILPNASSTKI
jgi:hypothetical protein